MHCDGVGAVEILHLGGYSLTEVSLEAVYAHFAENSELGSIPLAGCGICEVNDSHSGLPELCLEHAAVKVLDEVAALYALLKECGTLSDVGVDPYAYFKVLVIFETLEHSCGIGELSLIPLEVAPLEFLHPEAVEVEHLERDISLSHTVDKGGNSLFIIVGGERCGEPETECICRRKSRLSCKSCVI